MKAPIPLLLLLSWALCASSALGQNRSTIDLFGGGIIGETTWLDFENLQPQMPVFAAFGSTAGHNAWLVSISGDLDDLLWTRNLYQGRFFYLGDSDVNGKLSFDLVIPDVPGMDQAKLYIQALTYDSSFSSGPDMFDSISNLVLLKPAYEGYWRDHEESLPAAAHQAHAVEMTTARGGALQVLITGGGNALFQEAALKFETTDLAYQWNTTLQRMDPLPNMTEQRAGHSATPLGDGKILISGGMHYAGPDNNGFRTEVTNSVEMWDPEQWAFVPMSPMNEPRAFHQAVLLDDGRVLVIGGSRGFGGSGALSSFEHTLASAMRTTEIFDPAQGTWQQGPNLPEQNVGGRAIKDPGGAILLAGGINSQGTASEAVYRFDPQVTYVNQVAMMNVPRAFFSMVLLRDNRVFIAGGYEGGIGSLTSLNSTELFNPGSQTFSLSTPLPEPIAFGTAIQGILGNDMVYITGGSSENRSVTGSSLMTFNPNNESTASGRTSNQDHGGGIVITVGNGAIGVVSGAGSTPSGGWAEADGENMAPMD